MASSYVPSLEQFGALGNTPINTNFALNTGFRFLLQKIPTCTYFCTSVTTPSSSSSPISYESMPGTAIKFPGGMASTDVSIRFIIDEEFKNYMEMCKWFRTGAPYKNFKEVLPEHLAGPSDGAMLLLNNKKNPVKMITYRNLIPTQLSGFSLSHAEAEPSVLTATVNFVFDTSTVVDL